MKTRDEVQKDVDELNVLFQDKRVEFTLYEEHFVNRMDVGTEMVIVKGRVLIQKDGMPEMPKAVREMLENLKGMVEGAVKESSGKLPAMPEKAKDAALERFVEEVEGIEGVRKVILFKYDFHVEKGQMFDWGEILPSVVKALETLAAERDFEKNGMRGIEV